jgi:hypothetical protein
MTKKKIFTVVATVAVKANDEKTALELFSKVLKARSWDFKFDSKIVATEIKPKDKLANFRPAKEAKPAVEKAEVKKPITKEVHKIPSIGMGDE